MAERPILFSAPMVLALLDGTKTQTRRAFTVQPPPGMCVAIVNNTTQRYGGPGDRLWVRESLKAVYDSNEKIVDYAYAADSAKVARCTELAPAFSDGMAFAHLARPGGVPSIHMPRWASRILLEVTEVRVERLQAISRGDAMAEGCPFPNMAKGDDPRQWYRDLWDQINGAGAWDANPWCWVVSFQRIAS